MSHILPEKADIRQLRTQAKELLRTLPSGNQLADAQLLIARQYGFESWPKLVAKVETPALIEKLRNALDAGDAATIEKLLKSKPILRRHLNEPMFGFDTQPIIHASRHREAEKLLPVLVRYGADPTIRSKWWAGGFSALDFAKGSTVDLLLELGATWDVWSAAAQGRVDVLRALLAEDPGAVNAPGGDGQRPLHVAADTATAEFLIENGADLEVRDVDHESTPIQNQINRLEVVGVLLRHGAVPDVFTAVVLDDVALLERVLEADPKASKAHVGMPPFSTTQSNGGHIYAYLLGPTKTPIQVAVERKSVRVLDVLQHRASPSQRLVAAAWAEDGNLVRTILRENPGLDLGSDARAITEAAQAGKAESVRLLLDAGFDPKTPGMDSGSALHVACWFGHLDVVRLLVDRVPLDLPDAHHGSVPLGWACHGAHWCRNAKGNYPGVVETLLKAGADPHVPANSGGTTMEQQAGDRQDVIEALRRYR